VITPTRRALAEVTGLPVNTHEAVAEAAEQLRAAHGFGAVLVSSPDDGLTLVTADGVARLPAEAPEIYDVSGSRDALVATVAAGLAAGLSLPVAARLANIASGVVVGKAGTAVARTADLLAALSPPGGALRKVVTAEAAEEQAERWRQRGLRVGFTNGVFDLLHPGHVHLLEQARARCDRLVVAVNGDAGARRLKGAGRPVQAEAARAAVVASLSAVDLVVVFDQDTPEALLRALQPDLLIKGADYTVDTVVGADLVQDWGGRVVLAELLPGHSTTATVTRLRG